MADALCAEHPEVEFALGGPPPTSRHSALEDAALAIRRRCPVVEECLAYPIDGWEVGVWAAPPSASAGPASLSGLTSAHILPRIS